MKPLLSPSQHTEFLAGLPHGKGATESPVIYQDQILPCHELMLDLKEERGLLRVWSLGTTLTHSMTVGTRLPFQGLDFYISKTRSSD